MTPEELLLTDIAEHTASIADSMDVLTSTTAALYRDHHELVARVGQIQSLNIELVKLVAYFLAFVTAWLVVSCIGRNFENG